MSAPGAPLLVTGGTGFVASHLVDLLLRRGYTVRATVRDPEDERRTAPLRALEGAHPGRLELHRADLLEPGSFDAAARGCRVVLHVASPFLVAEQMSDPEREVVAPTVAGIDTVLDAVDRSESVERVVLTSTVGAMFGDYVDVLDHGGVLTEEQVNTTSTLEHNPYHHAKTVAERRAWERAGAQDRWGLVSLNPGLVLGPSMTPASASGSLFLVDELFGGQFFYGAPDFAFTVVDVRDVALAHLAAAERTDVHGRYILAHPTMVSFLEMARVVRRRHPLRLGVPVHGLPHAAVRVLGPRFGLSSRYVDGHLGIRFRVDNHRSVEDLGLRYRPVARTVLDTYDAWRARRRVG